MNAWQLIRRATLLLASATLPLCATAQRSGDAVVIFRYERPGLQVPLYVFTVHEDGSGTYVADHVAPPGPKYAIREPVAEPAKQSTQPLALSPPAVAKLFASAKSLNHFQMNCASRAKNIASTGAKTLTYRGPDGEGSCAYDYSENKAVVALTDTFQGMAFTLDAAYRLEFKQRFDRLGVDDEMGLLMDGVKEGRALELSNIAPTLRALAEDPQLLERVRTRAARLLEQAVRGL